MGRNTDSILQALSAHLVCGEQISAVRACSTGHSNETYLLEGVNSILRMPPVGPSLTDGLGMAEQFQLYAVLGQIAGAPPVPRVLYYCSDPAVLGAPFYLVERVPGEPFGDYSVTDWVVQGSTEYRSNLSRQYVGAYAALSKLRPLEVLGPVRGGVAESERWARMARTAQSDSLVELIERLQKIAPPTSGPASPVHGDPKMSNVLWLDGKLQTVLDWELAFNGDPLADLGYMLLFQASDEHPALFGFDLPGIWSRGQMIAEWERVSGRSARGIEWYEAATFAKVTAIIAYGYHLASTNQVADPRFLAFLPMVAEWTEVMRRIMSKLERPQ
jgi:aminoglycoside phosphotransferase (APT) family kinase protein